MTGRSRFYSLCFPTVLLCVVSFAINSQVLAKPKRDVGPGNGKALGKHKRTKENTPPTLAGTPDEVVLAHFFYDFVPDASDADGDSLTFSITNKPGWAHFDRTTGALYGTPTEVHIGHYSGIQISGTDGQDTAQLDAFAIDVTSTTLASVTLQWQPPTENTDGTSLTDLAGYRIYYGIDPADLANVIDVPNAGLTSFVVESLTPNIWYFAMTALNNRAQESALSDQVIELIDQ